MGVQHTPPGLLAKLNHAVQPLGYSVRCKLQEGKNKEGEYWIVRQGVQEPTVRIPRPEAESWLYPKWVIRSVLKRWERSQGIESDWEVREVKP